MGSQQATPRRRSAQTVDAEIDVEVIAHRGLPRKARENTLAGFELALAAGADGIELDVHATRDGLVVVHHDATLAPPAGAPTGTSGPAIATLTLAELRVAASGNDEIPTLAETLACVGDRAVLYVELKGSGIEQAVLAELAAHHTTAAVHSFDHRVSRHVRRLAPTMPTGILSASYLLEPGRALHLATARDYWEWWEMIDEALVGAVHAAGGRVIAWTVNSTEGVRRLAALDVDAVCTDEADVIVPLVRASRDAASAGAR